MPTKREREYYSMGYRDAMNNMSMRVQPKETSKDPYLQALGYEGVGGLYKAPKPKRKLSAWNKYVKANSKKPRFRYRNGKLNLKKMAVAFRKQRKRGGKR